MHTGLLLSGRDASAAEDRDRNDPVALVHERIERKRRNRTHQGPTITRNWATVGFFHSSPTLEQLRELADPEPPSPANERHDGFFLTESREGERYKQRQQPRTAPTLLQRSRHVNRRPMTGDVYFRKERGLNYAPTFEVSAVDESKEQAMDKNGFAISISELEDSKYFDHAMSAIAGLHDTPRPRTAPNLSRPATSRYTGLPARIDFFQLYKYHRHAGERMELRHSVDGSSASPVTARTEFVKLCNERLLPPVPFLTRCADDESPTLNLSGQGIGPRYVSALSKSFEKISFLKHVNLSRNQLDQAGAAQLLAALRQQNLLESIVLDNNRIGALGTKELLALITDSKCVLSEVRVAHNQLTDVEVAAIIYACLSITRTLTVLNVSGNTASVKAAEACSRLLQCDDLQLVELDLSWNTLRAQGAVPLFQSLAKHPLAASIQVLDLSWNGIGDGIAKALCAVLSTQAVEVVRLDHNRLTDTTMLALSQYLKSPEMAGRKPGTQLVLASNLCSQSAKQAVDQLLLSS